MSDEKKATREDRASPEYLRLPDRIERLEVENRFLPAANLIVATLPPGPDDLPEEHLPLAKRAVVLLSRGGDQRSAAEILVRCPVDLALMLVDETGQGVGLSAAALAESSGRPHIAFRLRSWLGHHEGAARLARQMGRHVDAGELFLRAQMLVEASHSFSKAGDRDRAIEALVGMESTDPSYRVACVAAIRLASEASVVSFALDRFV
ncbi:MAG: hypothetical protein JJE39_08890, partial [Vicinamibacteria bacterium]|nr:hypothetical protein [Vicinamibacteria bacterium]